MADKMGHNTYLVGYAKAHIANHTWRTAENSTQYVIPVLQSMANANPKLTLLDVGAGPGTISASFSKYMPNGQITATDLSEDVLKQAAEHAKSVGVHNIRFQAASVYDLPFPDGTFDVVHASQVICHLDSPVEALREMLRVVKPGGVLADREACMHMWSYWPQLPGIAKYHQMLNTVMEASGGSITAGPQLLSWAMKAGATREQITVSFGTWSYSTREEKEAWGGAFRERIANGEMRKKLLAMGAVTEMECDDMAKTWDEWIAADDACCGAMHGEIIVLKQ